MTRFTYKALDQRGHEISGSIDAETESEAISVLRSRSVQVLSIEIDQGFSLTEIWRKLMLLISIKRYTSPSSGDLVVFFRQMSLMLRAGNTLTQGLELCSQMTTKLSLRKAQLNMLVSIQGGSSFAGALEAEGRRFPPIVAKLVASGEASGELQQTLERLSESLERSASLRRQFLSSLTYPVLVVVAAVGVTLFLALSIVPKFAKLLEGRSQELPASTQLMLDISAWLVDYGLYLGIATGTTIFLILAAYTTVRGKAVVDAVLLRVPLVGTSIRNSGMAQMGWTMSMLLSSGLTVLEALRVVSGVIGNHRLGQCFIHASEQILAGQSLTIGLRQQQIPLMVQHMAGIGERSGELETVMQELGRYYQAATEARIKAMISMIEPAMTLVVGGLVGFVYYSFFKAMMQVSAG